MVFVNYFMLFILTLSAPDRQNLTYKDDPLV